MRRWGCFPLKSSDKDEPFLIQAGVSLKYNSAYVFTNNIVTKCPLIRKYVKCLFKNLESEMLERREFSCFSGGFIHIWCVF